MNFNQLRFTLWNLWTACRIDLLSNERQKRLMVIRGNLRRIQTTMESIQACTEAPVYWVDQALPFAQSVESLLAHVELNDERCWCGIAQEIEASSGEIERLLYGRTLIPNCYYDDAAIQSMLRGNSEDRISHNESFSRITIDDEQFDLTSQQAAVVRYLWEEAERGHRSCTTTDVQEHCEIPLGVSPFARFRKGERARSLLKDPKQVPKGTLELSFSERIQRKT